MAKSKEVEVISVPAARFQTVKFVLIGISPYMQARFSQKAIEKMKGTQIAGSAGKKGVKREGRDFDADYEGAKHISTEGWVGIAAPSFRNAMISACRLVGYKMTIAKLSVFVEADGYDKVDGTPLVHIDGEPERTEMAVRNATGVADIRVRPLWREWKTAIRVRYDMDQFSLTDLTNLLNRAGLQVGIGEGRPDSKQSAGQGFGMFKIETVEVLDDAAAS